jgi:hypothetical protein
VVRPLQPHRDGVERLHVVRDDSPDLVEEASMIADSLFRAGADTVYLAVSGGSLIISGSHAHHRVIVVARSVEQVRRFAQALFRREVSTG